MSEATTPVASPDDLHLIEQIAAQSHAAVATLYDRYGRLVFSVALRIVADRSVAEEITQDVFVSCWRNADRYRPSQGSVVTWLLAITHNRAIDELRSRRHKSQRREMTLEQAPTQALTNDHDVDLLLTQAQIREALASLPANQREVVELLYFGGMSRTEIADYLRTPLGTVHTRLRLAMHKLRVLLLPGYASDNGRSNPPAER